MQDTETGLPSQTPVPLTRSRSYNVSRGAAQPFSRSRSEQTLLLRRVVVPQQTKVAGKNGQRGPWMPQAASTRTDAADVIMRTVPQSPHQDFAPAQRRRDALPPLRASFPPQRSRVEAPRLTTATRTRSMGVTRNAGTPLSSQGRSRPLSLSRSTSMPSVRARRGKVERNSVEQSSGGTAGAGRETVAVLSQDVGARATNIRRLHAESKDSLHNESKRSDSQNVSPALPRTVWETSSQTERGEEEPGGDAPIGMESKDTAQGSIATPTGASENFACGGRGDGGEEAWGGGEVVSSRSCDELTEDCPRTGLPEDCPTIAREDEDRASTVRIEETERGEEEALGGGCAWAEEGGDVAVPQEEKTGEQTAWIRTMPGALLARLWPAERVVLGMRASRWLREELGPNVGRVVLCASRQYQHADMAAADVVESVRRFGGGSGVEVVCCRQGPGLAGLVLDGLKAAGGGSWLIRLDLGESRVGTEGVAAVGGVLEACWNLRDLELAHNEIDSEALGRLVSPLAACTRLRRLNIARNKVGSEGARALAAILDGCTTIQELDVSGNFLAAVGVARVAASLPTCRSLRLVNFARTGIGAAGAKQLVGVLRRCESLQTLDLSDNYMGGEGAGYVAEELRTCTGLRGLDLCNNKVGAEGAGRLADALGSCPALTRLDVGRNCMGGEGAARLAAALAACPGLTDLRADDNKMGGDGARRIAQALRRLRIRRLELKSNELGMGGAGVLEAVVDACTALHCLDLSGNFAGGDAGGALRGVTSSSGLRSLRLGHCRLGKEGVGMLAQVLVTCRYIAELGMAANDVDEEGARTLGKALDGYTELTALDLNGNRIGWKGGAWLGEGLKRCTALEVLDLGGAEIGADGMFALGSALALCRRIRYLDVGWNQIGNKGIDAVATGLKHWVCMEQLVIAGNGIGTTGSVSLARALYWGGSKALTHLDVRDNELRAEGATRIAQGLERCYRLRFLDVGCNAVGAEGAQALSEALRYCRLLTHLDMGQNFIGDEGAVSVARAAAGCEALEGLVLRENHIGVTGASSLAAAVRHCRGLTHLDLSRNHVGPSGAESVAKALSAHRGMAQLNLSRNLIGEEPASRLRYVLSASHIKV